MILFLNLEEWQELWYELDYHITEKNVDQIRSIKSKIEEICGSDLHDTFIENPENMYKLVSSLEEQLIENNKGSGNIKITITEEEINLLKELIEQV